MTAPAALATPTTGTPGRAGGLYAAPKGHMTPSLALLATFLAIDVASFVIPFYVSPFTESPWGSADRMEFLARGMASALAFGFFAAVAAERRNHSSWWFLLGHAGFPLALVFAIAGFDAGAPNVQRHFLDPREPTGATALVIAAGFLGTVVTLIATRRSKPTLVPMNAPLSAISRLLFRWGNIWLGIVLMVGIAATVAAGTLLENRYGAKGAQYLVYRSPWFGAIFFTGGMTMLCATFRKYPFRLEQAGWLTVHTGLAMVVIGGMSSFLSSVEGEVTIREGETAEAFNISTQTRLAMDEVVTRPNGTRTTRQLLRAIADFDVDPTKIHPDRAYVIDPGDGEGRINVVVDRYFGIGEAYSRWTDGGAGERLAIELDLTLARAARTERIRLDELTASETSLPFGESGFPITLFRAPPKMLDALLRPAGTGPGRLAIRDASGIELLSIPIAPPAGERAVGTPASLKSEHPIPGTNVVVKLGAYYDNMRPSRTRREHTDASPGNPVNPAIVLELAGPRGADHRTVFAYFTEAVPTSRPESSPSGAPKYPYQVVYECAPRIELEAPGLLFADVDGRLVWVFVSTSGERSTGDVKAGEDLPLPMPAFKLRPAVLYRRLRIEEGYEFKGYKADNQVIRVSVTDTSGAVAEPIWLKLGGRREFALHDRTFRLSWFPTARALGFSLKLNDFHRDFYPGSTEESSFESYCLLRHPVKFPQGEDVKIDMNHPLRLDGWRLFQSRFGGDGRTTILQVNRDPGLVITYPACAVVTLGLVVVFFMKRTLRLKRLDLERRAAPPGRHLAWAFGSVAAVGVGPVVFGLYAATHERLGLPLSGWPSFVFGVALLIIAPIAVVWIYVGPMSRRLSLAAGPTGPKGEFA
jgi:hypothetical protein